jgi:hypothetical protein
LRPQELDASVARYRAARTISRFANAPERERVSRFLVNGGAVPGFGDVDREHPGHDRVQAHARAKGHQIGRARRLHELVRLCADHKLAAATRRRGGCLLCQWLRVRRRRHRRWCKGREGGVSRDPRRAAAKPTAFRPTGKRSQRSAWRLLGHESDSAAALAGQHESAVKAAPSRTHRRSRHRT